MRKRHLGVREPRLEADNRSFPSLSVSALTKCACTSQAQAPQKQVQRAVDSVYYQECSHIEGRRKVQRKQEQELKAVTNGANIPGMLVVDVLAT